MLGACLVKALYALPTWTRVADLIAEHNGLSDALGGAPSHWACYRFARKLRAEREVLAGCLDALAASLREQYPEMGQDIAIDASDIAAYANGQRYLYDGGPERQRYSDPDATWGHRSAISTRKGGGYYGYKIHAAVCTRTGLPLAWRVETARHHESAYATPLLDAVQARGFQPQTCAMDKGYDSERIHSECEARGVHPVVPVKGAKTVQLALSIKGNPTRSNPFISRHTREYRDLYRRRSAIEREFGRLKHHYGLATLRVRGVERVRLHADLTIMGRLALELAKARAVPLAA